MPNVKLLLYALSPELRRRRAHFSSPFRPARRLSLMDRTADLGRWQDLVALVERAPAEIPTFIWSSNA